MLRLLGLYIKRVCRANGVKGSGFRCLGLAGVGFVGLHGLSHQWCALCV